MVNYKDFIRQVSKATGYSQKDVQEVLDNAEAILIENLKNDEEVKILRTISIVPTMRGEQEARNPYSGEKMMLPERRTIRAKISKSLKDLVK